MADLLYNTLNNGSNNLLGPFGNMQNFVQRLNQFSQTIQSDPKQQVQQLLNSGRMSQQQYNQLSQVATQIQKMMMKN